MKYAALLLLFPLMACDALPRDPEGTSARIGQQRSFSVGFADPGLAHDPVVRRFIVTLEQQAHAKTHSTSGSGETLLQQVRDGQVDIAIGRFREDSPWATEIAFGPALAKGGPKDNPIETKAAMRNGENRWIMAVERASRAVAPKDSAS